MPWGGEGVGVEGGPYARARIDHVRKGEETFYGEWQMVVRLFRTIETGQVVAHSTITRAKYLIKSIFVELTASAHAHEYL